MELSWNYKYYVVEPNKIEGITPKFTKEEAEEIEAKQNNEINTLMQKIKHVRINVCPDNDKFLGYADCVWDNCFIIAHIQIKISKKNNIFLSLPGYYDVDGEYKKYIDFKKKTIIYAFENMIVPEFFRIYEHIKYSKRLTKRINYNIILKNDIIQKNRS